MCKIVRFSFGSFGGCGSSFVPQLKVRVLRLRKCGSASAPSEAVRLSRSCSTTTTVVERYRVCGVLVVSDSGYHSYRCRADPPGTVITSEIKLTFVRHKYLENHSNGWRSIPPLQTYLRCRHISFEWRSIPTDKEAYIRYRSYLLDGGANQ
ncbi:hypothetical protein Tco_0781923 [Tanacetum coccineum]